MCDIEQMILLGVCTCTHASIRMHIHTDSCTQIAGFRIHNRIRQQRRIGASCNSCRVERVDHRTAQSAVADGCLSTGALVYIMTYSPPRVLVFACTYAPSRIHTYMHAFTRMCMSRHGLYAQIEAGVSLDQVFKRYDKDQDGTLSIKEMQVSACVYACVICVSVSACAIHTCLCGMTNSRRCPSIREMFA
jgi:hypothetical protein